MPPSSSPLVQSQLSTLLLLTAMYPLSPELTLAPSTSAFAQQAEEGEEGDAPDVLEVELDLRVDDSKGEEGERVGISVRLPTLPLSEGDEEEEARVEIHPKQPTWLPNSTYTSLLTSLPPLAPLSEGGDANEHILTTIDLILTTLCPYAPSNLPDSPPPDKEKKGKTLQPKDDGPQERVWFWFPALHTREKRKDLVSYANEWGLTGFVLAGKPALLCVEGTGITVEKYMSRIKSESWGDIPSFQKKVSERFRKELGPSLSNRAFSTMTDITNDVSKYGRFGDRGEMGQVKRMMEEWGVGEDFRLAVMKRDD
ncbi:hypothetical protein IAR50_007059 [Cryptococcus sp. DSM 104548]